MHRFLQKTLTCRAPTLHIVADPKTSCRGTACLLGSSLGSPLGLCVSICSSRSPTPFILTLKLTACLLGQILCWGETLPQTLLPHRGRGGTALHGASGGSSAEGRCAGHRQLLPSSGLPLAAALSGVDRRCLSHAVVLSGELVFVLFLTSVLSLDLSCCFPKSELQLVSVGDFQGRPTIYHTEYGEPSE